MRRLALSFFAFFAIVLAGLTAGSAPAEASCRRPGADGSMHTYSRAQCNAWGAGVANPYVAQGRNFGAQPMVPACRDNWGNPVPCQPYYPQQGGYPSPSGGCVGFVAGSQNGIVGFQVCGN